MEIYELILAAIAGAGAWGALHTGLFKKKNGLDKFAARMLEDENTRERLENRTLKEENNKLRKQVLELEKRLHELETKIRIIEGRFNGNKK